MTLLEVLYYLDSEFNKKIITILIRTSYQPIPIFTGTANSAIFSIPEKFFEMVETGTLNEETGIISVILKEEIK